MKTASNYAVLHNPTLVRCNYNFHNHIIIIQSVKPIAITLFKQSEELSDKIRRSHTELSRQSTELQKEKKRYPINSSNRSV